MSAPVLPVYSKDFTDMKHVPYQLPGAAPVAALSLALKEPEYENYRTNWVGCLWHGAGILVSSFFAISAVSHLDRLHSRADIQSVIWVFTLIAFLTQIAFSAMCFSKFFLLHDGFKFLRSFFSAFIPVCYAAMICMLFAEFTDLGLVSGFIAPFVAAGLYLPYYFHLNNEKNCTRPYVRIN